MKELCELAGIDKNGKVGAECDVLVIPHIVDILFAQERVKLALNILAQAL